MKSNWDTQDKLTIFADILENAVDPETGRQVFIQNIHTENWKALLHQFLDFDKTKLRQCIKEPLEAAGVSGYEMNEFVNSFYDLGWLYYFFLELDNFNIFTEFDILINGLQQAIVFPKEVKELVIPGNVKKITARAFRQNVDLEEVTVELPSQLEEIEKRAFTGCKNIKKVTIPNTVKRIGVSVFDYDCDPQIYVKKQIEGKWKVSITGGEEEANYWRSHLAKKAN